LTCRLCASRLAHVLQAPNLGRLLYTPPPNWACLLSLRLCKFRNLNHRGYHKAVAVPPFISCSGTKVRALVTAEVMSRPLTIPHHLGRGSTSFREVSAALRAAIKLLCTLYIPGASTGALAKACSTLPYAVSGVLRVPQQRRLLGCGVGSSAVTKAPPGNALPNQQREGRALERACVAALGCLFHDGNSVLPDCQAALNPVVAMECCC
jgi:hypothetical protein